jgi:hypothetical protein
MNVNKSIDENFGNKILKIQDYLNNFNNYISNHKIRVSQIKKQV